MKIMPSGDYYLWDCDWCDSRNRTLWTRIDEGKLVCGVCYASCHISITGQFATAPEQEKRPKPYGGLTANSLWKPLDDGQKAER